MKPEFKLVEYDPRHICWTHGNKLLSPRVLAVIEVRKKNKKESEAEKKDYERAKYIYDNFINVGVKFKPVPQKRLYNSNVIARITRVNIKNQTVSWVQDNFTEAQKKEGYKPAKGRWNICGMITQFKLNKIETC